jgi:hypothetical protein
MDRQAHPRACAQPRKTSGIRHGKGKMMSGSSRREKAGNGADNQPGIGENVRVISYNVPEDDRPGGIKVRFKIRIAAGKRAKEIDARQVRAILEVLQWQRQQQTR